MSQPTADIHSALIDTSIDGHVHTELCHHAVGTMEEYVQAAVAGGLKKIVFLEHLESGIGYFESTWLEEHDFEFYHAEGKRLQEKYAGRIAIDLGVEVGYNPARRQNILDRLQRHQWDRIGVSYNFVGIDGSILNVVSRKQVNIQGIAEAGIDRVITAYLQGLHKAVESLPGNVVCHIDAVARHNPGVNFSEKHLAIFDRLLDLIAARGMALEVNTSGFAHRNEPYPGCWLVARAMRRNIPLVAGSDSHRPDEVGRFFDQLPEFVQRCIHDQK